MLRWAFVTFITFKILWHCMSPNISPGPVVAFYCTWVVLKMCIDQEDTATLTYVVSSCYSSLALPRYRKDKMFWDNDYMHVFVSFSNVKSVKAPIIGTFPKIWAITPHLNDVEKFCGVSSITMSSFTKLALFMVLLSLFCAGRYILLFWPGLTVVLKCY